MNSDPLLCALCDGDLTEATMHNSYCDACWRHLRARRAAEAEHRDTAARDAERLRAGDERPEFLRHVRPW